MERTRKYASEPPLGRGKAMITAGQGLRSLAEPLKHLRKRFQTSVGFLIPLDPEVFVQIVGDVGDRKSHMTFAQKTGWSGVERATSCGVDCIRNKLEFDLTASRPPPCECGQKQKVRGIVHSPWNLTGR
jgi:hypothetical protein